MKVTNLVKDEYGASNKIKEHNPRVGNCGSTLLTFIPSTYLDSKTAIASSEPDPIVANGRVSVDP